MRPASALLALLFLAACGAAGAPERPVPRPAGGPAVDISGTASIGIAGGT